MLSKVNIYFLASFTALVLFSTSCYAKIQQDEPFPFTFPHDVEVGSKAATDFSYLNSSPAGSDGFVRIADGHFVTDKGRFRAWGVNFCFGANFPEHSESERIARRLSALGINCVRIHHHETSLSPSGLFAANGKMDPSQVDKLDYLLAELHKNGIYANINLHVGRSVTKSLGLPPLGQGHSASGDKHAMHFMPQIQEEFWKYCRDYIGHVNPYRQLARGSDPGIAMVEILNENRFSRDGIKYLKDAPPVYKDEILKQWNAWLLKKYKNDDALLAAWKSDGVAKTAPMADSSQINESVVGRIGGDWVVQDNGGQDPVTVKVSEGTLRIVPIKVAGQAWQQQVACEKLTFAQGEMYTLTFEIRADAEKQISFNTSTTANGWKQLGLGGSVVATPKWKTVSEVFQSTGDAEGHGRLAFDVGGTDVPFEMRNIKLQSGAGWKTIPDDQRISKSNVEIPGSEWTPAAYNAFIEFMTDTEREFYAKTTNLLRNELGVKVPICGTQTNYVGAKLASEIGDYTDMHSYWDHPLFQGRDWDQSRWTVGNSPIAAGPFENSWPRNNPLMRSAWRVHGKPFTYSEWNSGEPSLSSAGGISIMGLLGSLQDWDGIFFFDFEDQGGQWDDDQLNGFFRINGQPCKLALLGAFGKMYREGDIAALSEIHSSAEGAHFEDCIHVFTKLVGMDPNLPRVTGTSSPDPAEFSKVHPPHFESPDGTATWDATDKTKANIKINTPQTKAVWGLVGGQAFELGDWKVEFGSFGNNYGVMIATSRDGQPLSKSKSALISVVNHAENENMKWNEDRTSVGTEWGNGPTKTWGVPLTISLPAGPSELSVFAVDGAGKRLAEIAVVKTADGLQFELGSKYKTLLYELTWK